MDFLKIKTIVRVCIAVYLALGGVCHATGPVVFSTWEGMEADKLACIWLIQRFVSPGATIELYPKNQVPAKGIQFDTPYSEIRRQYNQSAFDSLLTHYAINNPRLSNIAALINDIEINVWEKKVYKKTPEMEFFFINLHKKGTTDRESIQKAKIFLDRLYETLADKLEKANITGAQTK